MKSLPVNILKSPRKIVCPQICERTMNFKVCKKDCRGTDRQSADDFIFLRKIFALHSPQRAAMLAFADLRRSICLPRQMLKRKSAYQIYSNASNCA
jgi:hypothetical protein